MRIRFSQLGLLMLLLLVLAFGAAAKAGTTPPISWNPASVDVVVARGSSADVVVSFTSSVKLRDVDLRVVPEITSFVKVTPASLGSVAAGETVSVTLTVSPGDATALGTYEAVIQVRVKSKNIALPLPVVVRVGYFVDASGANIVSVDSNATLSVPAGALSGDETITVEPSTSVPPADFGEAVSAIYDFGPNGLTFAQPVLLTIKYDPALVSESADLRIAFADASGNWTGLPTTVDASMNTASAYVTHFTRFGIVRPAPNLKAAPDPVTNLTATEDGTAIVLSWTPPATNYAYAEVRRSDNASGPFTVLAYSDPGATSFRDNAPLSGTSCYEVRAVNRGGFFSTPQSACVVQAPTSSVLFDKTSAANDAVACGIGAPSPLGADTEFVCGQQFVLSSTGTPTSFSVRLYVDGTATDGIVVEIRADSAGTPTGPALATSAVVSAASIPPLGADGNAGIVTFTFSSASSLPAGTYWVVLRTTGGPDSGRTYFVQKTLDRVTPWLQGAGVYASSSNSFPAWGTNDSMLRSKLEVSTP